MTATVASLLAALLAGGLAGLLYFGGLWWTVRRVAGSDRPALIMALSWVVRVAFALAVFASIMGDSWQRMAVALLGFIVARFVVIRFVAGGQIGGH